MAIERMESDAFAAVPGSPGSTVSERSSEMPVNQVDVNCPVCGYGIIAGTNGKRKLRTRVLIFNENGNTMGICPKCKTNLKVPVALVAHISPSDTHTANHDVRHGSSKLDLVPQRAKESRT